MSDPPPLVSVILPVFNRRDLVVRAVASVREQSYPQWELVVVDDGSADGTAGRIEELVARDARIRLFRQDHAGPSAARNRALKEAQGKYVCCLDSDDEYLPEHIALRVAYMESHPAIRFLHGGFRVIGWPERHFVPDARDRSRLIPIADCTVGGTFFGLRDAFVAAGGWMDTYSEDSDLFERVRRMFPVAEVSHQTYLYHRDTFDSRCDEAAEDD